MVLPRDFRGAAFARSRGHFPRARALARARPSRVTRRAPMPRALRGVATPAAPQTRSSWRAPPGLPRDFSTPASPSPSPERVAGWSSAGRSDGDAWNVYFVVLLPLLFLVGCVCQSCFLVPERRRRVSPRRVATEGGGRRRRRRRRDRRDALGERGDALPRVSSSDDEDEDDRETTEDGDPDLSVARVAVAARRRDEEGEVAVAVAASDEDDASDDASRPATRATVASLPRCVAGDERWRALAERRGGGGDADADVMDDACAICCEDVRRGEAVRALECGHAFHDACARRWLKIRASCPACRASVRGMTEQAVARFWAVKRSAGSDLATDAAGREGSEGE